MPDALSPLHHPWSDPTLPARRVELIFGGALADDNPFSDLSAAVRIDNTLFLGSDEGAHLERLQRDGDTWSHHIRLPLAKLLDLVRPDEVDIEGLAVDDGWLWVLGSHARTRPNIARRSDFRIDLNTFADLKDTRSRCLLARLPLVPDPDAPGALLPVRDDGVRRAGLLRQSTHGNALAKALARDPLIKPFTRIPAKEGGVDLEGIAVAGSRVALGMRGPVLQSYAVLLELELSAKRSGRLRLTVPPCKRLLDLDGLGIRDLKRHGADLLVLAGPTTALDGPCAVYRWRGWLHDAAKHDNTVRLHRPERLIDLPFGRGDDHPEGLTLIDDARGTTELLVVCDTPSKHRLVDSRRALCCDIFELPD